MSTEKLEKYESVDGVMTLVSSEDIEVNLDAEIQNKEAEVLAMYEELETLKAQKATE